jgi:hypothetical protein
MRRETAKPGPTRPPPRRSSTAPCRLCVSFIPLAILILFAHLLVVAHTFSHFSDSPVEGTSRHCVICSFGGHSAGVPAAMLAASAQTVTWIAGFSSPQSPPTRFLDGATFARAPPLAPLIVTIV